MGNEFPNVTQWSEKDNSLLQGKIIINPTNPIYDDILQTQRTWAGITRTNKGRIFVSYYSSPEHADEAVGNYAMIVSSDDRGQTFQNRIVIAPPIPENTRVFDPNLWTDCKGRLWIFWSQSYKGNDGRCGVWAACCENPDVDDMNFTAPKRIAQGILATHPIITKEGAWLLPTYIWAPRVALECRNQDYFTNALPDNYGVNVYRSNDCGETFECISSNIQFAFSSFDEPSMVERKDGSLWMLIRGSNCVGESVSHDGGFTWSHPRRNIRLNLPDSHFHLGKLKSGNLLLIANYKADMFSYYSGRNHLTALLSKDDGNTWSGILSIDEREGTEQPDFVEGNDGFIYISYGRAPQIAGETLMAVITEEDILAGKLKNPKSKLRIHVGKAKGIERSSYYESWVCKVATENNIEL